MSDLWTAVQADLKSLSEEVTEFSKLAQEAARADAAYRERKAKAMLEAKASGMAVGLCEQCANADQGVIDALVRRGVSQALADASRERINALKLQIRVGQEQMAREWAS